MNSKKLFYGLIGLLILLGIGIFAGVDGASMLLQKQSDSLVKLKASDKALAQEKVQLAKNKQDIKKYAELNTIAKSVVPQDKDQAEAVREIVNLAAQSGISKISSIAFPASNLGGTTGTTTLKTTGKTPTQVTPVKGIPGVYDLQITITQANTDPVPYSSFITFLSKLEQNRRTAQVSSINVSPDPKNASQVSFTLVIDEFIKP